MTVCGGSAEACLIYNLTSDKWKTAPFSLIEKRESPASVLLDNGTMIIIGGYTGWGVLDVTFDFQLQTWYIIYEIRKLKGMKFLTLIG